MLLLQVAWRTHFEPYIVGEKAYLPYYNESLLGRGYDKIAHLFHIFAMGYTFCVFCVFGIYCQIPFPLPIKTHLETFILVFLNITFYAGFNFWCCLILSLSINLIIKKED